MTRQICVQPVVLVLFRVKLDQFFPCSFWAPTSEVVFRLWLAKKMPLLNTTTRPYTTSTQRWAVSRRMCCGPHRFNPWELQKQR